MVPVAARVESGMVKVEGKVFLSCEYWVVLISESPTTVEELAGASVWSIFISSCERFRTVVGTSGDEGTGGELGSVMSLICAYFENDDHSIHSSQASFRLGLEYKVYQEFRRKTRTR